MKIEFSDIPMAETDLYARKLILLEGSSELKFLLYRETNNEMTPDEASVTAHIFTLSESHIDAFNKLLGNDISRFLGAGFTRVVDEEREAYYSSQTCREEVGRDQPANKEEGTQLLKEFCEAATLEAAKILAERKRK